MILIGSQIAAEKIFDPYVGEKTIHQDTGMSYGQSYAGYDIRLGDDLTLVDFALGVSLEHFLMPRHLIAFVNDKSSWARQGVNVLNTVIEPGWRGYLTLELANLRRSGHFVIKAGTPIAQIVFHRLAEDAAGYQGKYQDQENEPVSVRRD